LHPGRLGHPGLAIGWLWLSYSSASDAAAAARSRADQLDAAAESARQAAETWRRNAESIAETLGQRQKREQDLRARLSETHNQLEEARHVASKEVRDCLDMRLPGDYLDGLRPGR